MEYKNYNKDPITMFIYDLIDTEIPFGKLKNMIYNAKKRKMLIHPENSILPLAEQLAEKLQEEDK